LTFRPDIQGMRALAILAVVACHAGWTAFAGGFVGVDIFFVISGYLITGLLLRELQANGKVDLLGFYARRLKRLVPALMLVLAVTLLLARVLRAPLEQFGLAKAVMSAALWVSNFYFAFAEVDYFEPNTFSEPVLHTWSLGVEEQFYLIWPFLLVGLYGARAGTSAAASHVLKGLLLVLCSSFALCLWLSYTALQMAFYLMPGRAWQFALGGLVFVLAEMSAAGKGPAYLRSERLAGAAGMLGLAAIAASIVLFGEDQVYPGYLIVLPTLGAALLLHAGAVTPSGFMPRLLALRWLQGLGTVSYAWYLWHWPILVLGKDVFGARWGGVQLDLALIAASLALAVLTWYAVERPLRYSAALTRKPALTFALTLALAGVVLGGADWMARRVPSDSVAAAQAPYLVATNGAPSVYAAGCDQWYHNARVVSCRFGDGSAMKRAVLVGDSIGIQWTSALVSPLALRGWTVDVYTKSGCPIVVEPLFYDRVRGIYTICSQWLDDLLTKVAKEAPDVVFIGSSAQYAFSAQQWEAGTERVLTRLAPAVDNIYLLRSTFELPYHGPICLARNAWRPALLAEFSACAEGVTEAESDVIALAGLQAAVADYGNVFLVDPNPLVCPDRICAPVQDDAIVYRDRTHLAEKYVESIAQPLWNLLQSHALLP
jgi:peptidoglycan/LPS O-acetylase OafA/YrhL